MEFEAVARRTDLLRLTCALLVAYGCGRSQAGESNATGGSAHAGTAAGGKAGQPGSSGSGGARAGGGAKAGAGGALRGGAGGMSATGGSGGGGAVMGGDGGSTSGAAGRGGQATAGDGGASAAGAPEAGNAGSAGDGGDPDACHVTVPSGVAAGTLQAAIDDAPVPSTVCLLAGRYAEDLQLRAGVSVRGSGIGSVVCGTVIGDAATGATTTLSDLQIAGRLRATGNVKLALRHLEINTGVTQVCAPGSDPVRIVQNGSGALDLVIDGVSVGAPGFDISVKPGSEPIDDSIVIQNSRCDRSSQCYDFLRFAFATEPAAEAPAGSRLMLDVFNNVVRSTVLEAVVFEISGGMNAADTAASRLWFRHNTLASNGDLNTAIAFWTPPTLPVTLANNTVAYIDTPVQGDTAPMLTLVGNAFSDDVSSTDWFVDFAAGDFVPSAGSPLIGAGADAYGVPTDIDGKSRVGGFDSGAYQH